jgi:signal peptidase II
MATGLGRPAEEHRADSPEGISVRWRRLSILGIAVAVLAADQGSKTWALHHAQDPVHVVGTLRLAVTFNPGTAFGLGQNSTSLIVGGVVVLVVVLLGLGRRVSRTATWPAVMAMGLLLGGAVGNLTDRLVRHHHGAVIDFIDLRWWPVFNVADAAISVGACLLALVLFRARPVPSRRHIGAATASSPRSSPGPSSGSSPGSAGSSGSSPGSAGSSGPSPGSGGSSAVVPE